MRTMNPITWLKRLFLVEPGKKPELEKRRPHKAVRTKAQTAQKRMSDMAAKEAGGSKLRPASKSRSKREK